MSQLTAGAGPYLLTASWYDSDGALDPDVGAVTIGIVDGNGDEVVEAGTATTNNEDGTYEYSLASQANPDQLTATWTATMGGAKIVQRIEIVGSQLFTVAAARAFGAKADATAALKPLASTTEYPTPTIRDERSRIVEDFEYWTGRAWIPRYARVELHGNGGTILPLRRGVARTSDGYMLNRPGRHSDIAVLLSVTVDGTAVDVADIEVDPVRATLIHTESTWTSGTVSNPYNVVVEYVYGPPYLVDGVDRVAMRELVDRLVPSAYPDRALRIEGEFGTMQLIQPGGPMRNVSRVPMVNAWISAHDARVLVG